MNAESDLAAPFEKASLSRFVALDHRSSTRCAQPPVLADGYDWWRRVGRFTFQGTLRKGPLLQGRLRRVAA